MFICAPDCFSIRSSLFPTYLQRSELALKVQHQERVSHPCGIRMARPWKIPQWSQPAAGKSGFDAKPSARNFCYFYCSQEKELRDLCASYRKELIWPYKARRWVFQSWVRTFASSAKHLIRGDHSNKEVNLDYRCGERRSNQNKSTAVGLWNNHCRFQQNSQHYYHQQIELQPLHRTFDVG